MVTSLEGDNDIETELKAMKAEMLPGGRNSQPHQDTSELKELETGK